MAEVQSLFCGKALEAILTNEQRIKTSVCISYLDRIIRTCGIVRGRKSFPTMQDQSLISSILRVAIARQDVRDYLCPYFENILEIIQEFREQTSVNDLEFLSTFFGGLVTIKCAVKEIISVLWEVYDVTSLDSKPPNFFWDISKDLVDDNYQSSSALPHGKILTLESAVRHIARLTISTHVIYIFIC